MSRPRLVLAMDPARTRHVLSPALLDRLAESVEILDRAPVTRFAEAAPLLLREAQVLLTGWGCPAIGAAELALMPRLALVAHAAGTVKTFLSDAVFEAGIAVTTAAEANAQPVAEFTLAMILLANKRALAFHAAYRRERGREASARMADGAIGNLGRTVGIVGASRIGRRVLALLAPFDLDRLLFDPFVGEAEARALGARKVDLDELLSLGDVVSLHAPSLPETRHMIGAAQLARLRDGAVLVNTARGALVDEAALLAELRSGRISAAIDVTEPEVPPPDSAFFDLPNLFLTPHIAGAVGLERARLGLMAVEEIERFARGEPLNHALDAARLDLIA